MGGLLSAFATIWAVTAVGWLITRYGLLGPQADTVLARLVFFVATPALLLVTLANSSLDEFFTPALAAFVVSTVVVQATAIAVARYAWHWPRSESVVAGLSASYVNAANLGIPVAAYALGDVSFAAPVLLFQVLVAAPLALAVLEWDSDGHRPSLSRLALLPARNPIMLASATGLVLALAHWRLPEGVLRPFDLLGTAAVPVALLALGVSLVGGGVGRNVGRGSPSTKDAGSPAGAPVPGSEGSRVPGSDGSWVPGRSRVVTLVALKVVAQPLLAYLFAQYALGLSARPLLAAVITSGLPTAQNVFVFASRYQRAARLARDSVVITTLVTAVSLLGIAYWLG